MRVVTFFLPFGANVDLRVFAFFEKKTNYKLPLKPDSLKLDKILILSCLKKERLQQEFEKLIQHSDYDDSHFEIEGNFKYPITQARAVEIIITLDNFEDGQYDEDNSIYSVDDNAFIEELITCAMNHKRKDEEED